MPPEHTRSRQWMRDGTKILDRALAAASDEHIEGPSLLPGWTGRHLLAHLAANAEALRNLATWARTGIETPMYSSPEQRNHDIETGSRRPVPELRDWCATAAAALDADLASLAAEQWQAQVRTAQGRTVPTTEVPWMRAREVMVHAVDLSSGTTVADLPNGFLLDLIDDIVLKRTATAGHPALEVHDLDTNRTWAIGDPSPDARISGPTTAIAAYLSGRSDWPGQSAADLTTTDGSPVPELPPWL